MNFENLTRPFVRDVTPYFPGKPIAEVQRELGLKRVIKLASNENFLGPTPRALAVVRRHAQGCYRYPEGASPLLRRALAELYEVDASQVLIGNGSDEIIRLLCEALLVPDDEVLVSQYGFIRFKQHAALMGAKVIEVPMADWTHDLETMGRTASTRTKIVFVASPNNPTGTYNTTSELLSLLKKLSSNTLLVLDEAYYHYVAEDKEYPQSLPALIKRHANLVVLRTFSKAYGLAGLRVGVGVADTELISWLDRIRLPFNVNVLAQSAALEALKDKAFLRRGVRVVIKNRESLAAELRHLGLSTTDSGANFLFVHSTLPGRALFKNLLQLGIIIRPLDEYGLPNHVRITVGSASENRALVLALRQILAPRKSHGA